MKIIYGYTTAANGLLQIVPEQGQSFRKSIGNISPVKAWEALPILFSKGFLLTIRQGTWGRSVLDAILSNLKTSVESSVSIITLQYRLKKENK